MYLFATVLVARWFITVMAIRIAPPSTASQPIQKWKTKIAAM